MSARRRRRGLPVRRDSLLFALGAAGIGYQQYTEHWYVPALIIYGLMCGVPGLAQLVIALHSLTRPTEDEGDSPTPSSPPPSQAPLSSSSSG